MSECLLLGAGYGEVVFKRDERVVHMGREKIAADAIVAGNRHTSFGGPPGPSLLMIRT